LHKRHRTKRAFFARSSSRRSANNEGDRRHARLVLAQRRRGGGEFKLGRVAAQMMHIMMGHGAR